MFENSKHTDKESFPRLSRRDECFSVLSSLPWPVLAFGDGSSCLFSNAAAEEMIGLSPEQLAGDGWLTSFEREERRKVRTWLIEMMGEGTLKAKLKAKSGVTLDKVELTSTVFNAKNGGQIRFVFVKKEIDAKEIEWFFQSKKRVDLALNKTGIGLWEWEPIEDCLVVNDEWARMLGWRRSDVEIYGFDVWKASVHPDDRDQVIAVLKDHLEDKTPYYDSEYRMRSKDGRWIWISSRGIVVDRDAEGRPCRIIGTTMDVTSRKVAEEELKQSRNLVEQITESCPDTIIVVDFDLNRVAFSNRSLRAELGWTDQKGPQSLDDLRDLIHADDRFPAMQHLQRIRNGVDLGQSDMECRMMTEAGREVWTLWRASQFSGSLEQGGKGQVLCIIQDITVRRVQQELAEKYAVEAQRARIELQTRTKELEQAYTELETANQDLETLSQTDSLTGLGNHRSFHEGLEEAKKEAEAKGRPASLLILDVDDFKSLNDVYGHLAGDQVLRELAQIVKNIAGPGESVSRYGGEEFAVVIPHTDAKTAMKRADDFLKAVENYPWTLRNVTISIGVSTITSRSKEIRQVIHEADQALYDSKRSGRNRCTHFDSLKGFSFGLKRSA